MPYVHKKILRLLNANRCIIFSVVILSGTTDNPTFRGFLIQGRLAADGTTLAGSFYIGATDQKALCMGNVSNQLSYLLLY